LIQVGPHVLVAPSSTTHAAHKNENTPGQEQVFTRAIQHQNSTKSGLSSPAYFRTEVFRQITSAEI
jgi:hypothetical protein